MERVENERLRPIAEETGLIKYLNGDACFQILISACHSRGASVGEIGTGATVAILALVPLYGVIF